MPENEATDNQQEEEQPKSKLPVIVIGGVALVAVLAVLAVMMMKSEPEVQVEAPPAEFVVTDKMYQLKDGSYLRLGFSIVVSGDKVETLRNIVETEAPGRLPDGVNMIVGNKTRDDLISGTHKREAFARELKKMLEDRVFSDHNRRQVSADDTIQIEEVLISHFVTQEG